MRGPRNEDGRFNSGIWEVGQSGQEIGLFSYKDGRFKRTWVVGLSGQEIGHGRHEDGRFKSGIWEVGQSGRESRGQTGCQLTNSRFTHSLTTL